MEIDLVTKILQNLYANTDGYNVSAQARKRLGLSDKALTYGEVVPEQFQKILALADPKPQEVFYDLGSGLGKPIFLAGLFFDFSKLVGVEMLSDLCEAANIILKKYEIEVKPTLDEKKRQQKISFINENFLNQNIADADVIFTHSTCFSLETMADLARKLEEAKPGLRLLTVTKTIKSPFFQFVKSAEYFMNWGRATIYLYKKIV